MTLAPYFRQILGGGVGNCSSSGQEVGGHFRVFVVAGWPGCLFVYRRPVCAVHRVGHMALKA